MYLWQEIFTAPENTSWSGRMPGMLACIALAPVLSYELIEQPVLRLRTRWMGGGRSVAAEVEAETPSCKEQHQARRKTV
jgi:peptidoglycan/LPS O-acetylase OafA/YrhL